MERNDLFPTLDDDQLILLLLFDAKDEIPSDKFIQAICVEANIRYEVKRGEGLFSYKFQDPCFVPPNDNKIEEDIDKLRYLGYVYSRVIIDPVSLKLNEPRLIRIYTPTPKTKLELMRFKLNEREVEAQQIFKDILKDSEENSHDALSRYQQHFLEYSKKS